jgi:hypothetical protein
MFQRISSLIAAACIFAFVVGCGAKDPAAERAAKVKEAKERIIRAKTRDERVAAQGALRQLEIQEGTGFQSQANPSK